MGFIVRARPLMSPSCRPQTSWAGAPITFLAKGNQMQVSPKENGTMF